MGVLLAVLTYFGYVFAVPELLGKALLMKGETKTTNLQGEEL